MSTYREIFDGIETSLHFKLKKYIYNGFYPYLNFFLHSGFLIHLEFTFVTIWGIILLSLDKQIPFTK